MFFMWEGDKKEFKTSLEVSTNFTDPFSLVKQLSLSTFSILGEIVDDALWFIKRCLKWCVSTIFPVAFTCFSV